jgi:hypothetical protein
MALTRDSKETVNARIQRDPEFVIALLDEAMREFLERRNTNKPRQHVMEQLGLSIQEFDSLYQKLAK